MQVNTRRYYDNVVGSNKLFVIKHKFCYRKLEIDKYQRVDFWSKYRFFHLNKRNKDVNNH